MITNRLHDVFDHIHVEDSLKEKTAHFLSEEIQKRSRLRRAPRMRLAAVCASFILLFLVGGFSYNLYLTPSAYVDMDVNPSIGLMLNRFGRVLEAKPYNDDGSAILQSIDVRHKPYEQAVQTLLDEMIRQGYLKPDGLVSVTVQTDNGNMESQMLADIQVSVDKLLASHHYTAAADIFAVTQETRDCAHEFNLSPAKYLAIAQLQEVDPAATFGACAEHSISEIRQLTEDHGGEHHGQSTSPSNRNDVRSGQPTEGDCEEEDGHSSTQHGTGVHLGLNAY